MTDLIELRAIRADGCHGVAPEERAQPQPFEVDVVLVWDLRAAGASDLLEDTIDYGAVARLVRGIVEAESFQLLERMADVIALGILAEFRPDRVTVRVRKMRPPIPDIAWAGVEVTRSPSG